MKHFNIKSRLQSILSNIAAILTFGFFSKQGKFAEFAWIHLVWLPLIILVWSFAFIEGGESFNHVFFRSLIIAEVVAGTCILGEHIIFSRFLNWCRLRRGLPSHKSSRMTHAVRSLLFILPGMWLGFRVSAAFAPLIGYRGGIPNWEGYKVGCLVSIFSLALFTAFNLATEAKMLKMNAEKNQRLLESENAKAHIAALTAQMNPHLLFNSLNSIASMIHGSPEIAETMTVKLSSLYRLVLSASQKEHHSLADELAILKSYLHVESIRFGSRLTYVFDVDSSIQLDSVFIPALILQPYVENAVKHGIFPLEFGGEIGVRIQTVANEIHIEITDTGEGFGLSQSKSGSGSAMKNCEARLKLFFGPSANVTISPKSSSGGTRVILSFEPRSNGSMS